MSSDAEKVARDATANARFRAQLEESWEPIRLHITDFPIEQSPLTSTPVDIRVVQEKSLQEFSEATIALIEQESHPTNISIDCLSAYFMEEASDDIMAAIAAVSEAAIESKIHRVTFSTLRYSPEFERHWNSLGQLNNRIRQHNINQGEQTLSLHKVFLTPRAGRLETFGECYEEFTKKISLGSTPNELGAQIVLSWVLRHHQNAYQQPRKPDATKKLAPLPMPVPLSMSEEYAENEAMVAILKSRGMFSGRRTRSASRRGGATRRTSHRTISRDRSNSMVSGAKPRGARSPQSLGALERLLHQVSRGNNQGCRQNRDRESSRVTDRIASLYRQKCDENTRLHLELESTALEMELLKENQQEQESEVIKLRSEIQKLRETVDWQDTRSDKLNKIKGVLYNENKLLEDELKSLRLSKKHKKAKKDKKRRDRN